MITTITTKQTTQRIENEEGFTNNSVFKRHCQMYNDEGVELMLRIVLDLLDAHILKPGDDTEDLPDSYVIFITENDVMGKNQAVYHIQRYVRRLLKKRDILSRTRKELLPCVKLWKI